MNDKPIDIYLGAALAVLLSLIVTCAIVFDLQCPPNTPGGAEYDAAEVATMLRDQQQHDERMASKIVQVAAAGDMTIVGMTWCNNAYSVVAIALIVCAVLFVSWRVGRPS